MASNAPRRVMANPIEIGQIWQVNKDMPEDVINWGLGLVIKPGDKFLIRSVDEDWVDREDQLYCCRPLNIQNGEFSLFWMTITQFCHQVTV